MKKTQNIIKNIIIYSYLPLILFFLWNYLHLKLRVSLAEGQVRITRNWAKNIYVDDSANEEEIDRMINLIKADYPSGTKQIKGSSLDFIVECNRDILIDFLNYKKKMKNKK